MAAAIIYGGQAQVEFDGHIHLEGSISGGYTIYNPNGQQIGDQGSWSVAPN